MNFSAAGMPVRAVSGGRLSRPRQRLHPVMSSHGDPHPVSHHPTASSLARLPKVELQLRAREAGLPTHGTKAEIAARLAAITAKQAGSQIHGSISSPKSRHGVTMEEAMRPGGAISQAITGHLRSQLDPRIGGSWQELPHGGDPGNSNGHGNGNGAPSGLGGQIILDPASSKHVLEALGEQLGILVPNDGDGKPEKWIGEVSVIQVAAAAAAGGMGGAAWRQDPGPGNGGPSGGEEREEDAIKLQVQIRVVGKSRREVEAALQEEACRERGAGKSAVIGNVWKESEQEEHLMELLSARYA